MDIEKLFNDTRKIIEQELTSLVKKKLAPIDYSNGIELNIQWSDKDVKCICIEQDEIVIFIETMDTYEIEKVGLEEFSTDELVEIYNQAENGDIIS